MSLFSFLRKNKQEPTSDDRTFYSRAEEDSKAVRSRGKRRQSTQTNQSNAPVDPVLPEKKRARRRLIGVVALVLAAVVGLPMVLDSEPKPLADDLVIQIPSKDKTAGAPMRPPVTDNMTAAASLDPKEEVIEPAVAEPKLPPASSDAVNATNKTQDKAFAENQPTDTKAKAGDDKSNATALTAKSDVKPESKQASRTDNAANAAASAEAARARALLEGNPDPKAAEKNPGKFVVQVAALASQEKVNELQSKLKDAGIKSYTQKVATNSGERIRVRVGPFASKEEAEKARAKIVKLGLNGSLVPA